MNILVTGGAGYIGSHIAQELLNRGHRVVVIDTNHHGNIIAHDQITYLWGNYADPTLLATAFATHQCTAVMHCAANIEVGASVKSPNIFYENNVINSLALLNAMHTYHVPYIIFSSSCAVYGIPDAIPLREETPREPISPYGNTKYIVELALHDYARAYALRFAALRYFNAAGGTPKLNLGERHEPETHLIPLALRAVRYGQPFTIFGNDYDTPDGTCIRDFLHVRDIARAHCAALNYLTAGGSPISCNLGTGNGYSVHEVLTMVEAVTQRKIERIIQPRRPGDPARLIADKSFAERVLAWHAEESSLQCIVQDAWDFYGAQQYQGIHESIKERHIRP